MLSAARPITIVMAEDDPDDRMLAQEAMEECMLANSLVCVENGEELQLPEAPRQVRRARRGAKAGAHPA
jgi:hypothetical protein